MKRVKNIHLCGVSKLYNETVCVNTKSYNDYIDMYEFSKYTFEKNLLNVDEFILLNSSHKNIQAAFRARMKETYDIWKKNYPCNILYTGADTVCLRECDLFGKYKEFRMFGCADNNMRDKSLEELRSYNPYLARPEGIFNCDVRYFPKELTEEFWEKLISYANKWANFWHVEQNIYNTVFVNQDITRESIIDSTKYAYQLIDGTKQTEQNGVTLDDAQIIHFHSSKGVKSTFMRMMNVFKYYNI